MNTLLAKCNTLIRNDKNIIHEDCIIRKREKLLHVCLNSCGCRFRKTGSCIMCNYGQGHILSKEQMDRVLKQVAFEAEGMDSVLIGTLGSIFDPEEVLPECLEMICDKLNQLSARVIIFETHYLMVTRELCVWLKEKLPNKDVVIELGLESADEFVQNECLNKKINLEYLCEKIKLIHDFGFSVTANVFLGSPFLSVREQISDTTKTILWAINHSVDSTVIFPMNIRKDTLIALLYQNDKYERVSQWQILEVLQNVPEDYLNHIYFAWYGDWTDLDEEGNAENLPPISCQECHEKWMQFYHEFLSLPRASERKALLEQFADNSTMCDCYHSFENSLHSVPEKGIHERVTEAHTWLKKYIDMYT